MQARRTPLSVLEEIRRDDRYTVRENGLVSEIFYRAYQQKPEVISRYPGDGEYPEFYLGLPLATVDPTSRYVWAQSFAKAYIDDPKIRALAFSCMSTENEWRDTLSGPHVS